MHCQSQGNSEDRVGLCYQQSIGDLSLSGSVRYRSNTKQQIRVQLYSMRHVKATKTEKRADL